jgi:hypothetical protein
LASTIFPAGSASGRSGDQPPASSPSSRSASSSSSRSASDQSGAYQQRQDVSAQDTIGAGFDFDIDDVLQVPRPVAVRLSPVSSPLSSPGGSARPAAVPDAEYGIVEAPRNVKRVRDDSFRQVGDTFVTLNPDEEFRFFQQDKLMRDVQLQRAMSIRYKANDMVVCEYIPVNGAIPATHLASDGVYFTDVFGDEHPCCRECHGKHHQSLLRRLSRKPRAKK